MALHRRFYDTLPDLPEIAPGQADIAWLVYDLARDPAQNVYNLELDRTVYTLFGPVLERIAVPEPGPVEAFMDLLQERLDEKLDGSANPPDAPTLADLLDQE